MCNNFKKTCEDYFNIKILLEDKEMNSETKQQKSRDICYKAKLVSWITLQTTWLTFVIFDIINQLFLCNIFLCTS